MWKCFKEFCAQFGTENVNNKKLVTNLLRILPASTTPDIKPVCLTTLSFFGPTPVTQTTVFKRNADVSNPMVTKGKLFVILVQNFGRLFACRKRTSARRYRHKGFHSHC